MSCATTSREIVHDEEEEWEEGEEDEGAREGTSRGDRRPVVSPTLSPFSPRPPPSPSLSRKTPSIRSHCFVELTSLDDLSFPTNAPSKSIKYTCVSASRRLLVLGTCTGTVYVFARYASKQRARLTTSSGSTVASPVGTVSVLPLHVFTTKDGLLNRVRISPNEQLIAVGGDSGRVSVLSLSSPSSSTVTPSLPESSRPPSSPMSALVHTVPGDARRADRVNCLCWSDDSSALYAAHVSGLVAHHKIGTRRSVFRSAVDRLVQLDGEPVQMEMERDGGGRLLISTVTATFVYDLAAASMYQVGKKPRNGPMGACWMPTSGSDSPSAAGDYVLAARQNGRIWEASPTGIVYKTHQLRQSEVIPVLDAVSFRPPPPDIPVSPRPSHRLQHSTASSTPSTTNNEEEDEETVRASVQLGTLHPITDEGSPEDSSAQRFVVSWTGSRLIVVDVDRSQLTLITDLKKVIRDVSVCCADVFVLFSGSVGVRKYTLATVEGAADRLLQRKAVMQAARLVLSTRPPSQWSMPLIERISNALAAMKKKESESLRRQLSGLVCGGGRKASIEEYVMPFRTDVHRVISDRRLEERGKDEFGLSTASSLRERSRSSPDNSLPPLSPQIERRRRQDVREERKSHSARESKERRGGRDEKREEELRKAHRILDSDPSRAEHRDSLRTLLELGSPPPLDFKHSVTVASVARNLAELARVAPPAISDLLVQRRVSKPSSGKKGAKVVKAIRPFRSSIRRSREEEKEREEANSNLVDGGMVGEKLKEHRLVEDGENNVEWREKRMGGVFEEGAAVDTHGVVEASREEEEVETSTACGHCGLHKSWLAVFLFGTATGRVTVVCGEQENGAVPCTLQQWETALSACIQSTKKRRKPCAKCTKAVQRATRPILHGPFCDGLRPEGGRVDVERIRQKVLALPDEVLLASLTGYCAMAKGDQRKVKGEEENMDTTSTKKENSTALNEVPVAQMEHGNALEKKSEKEEGEDEEMEEEGERRTGIRWLEVLSLKEVLIAALFCLSGPPGLKDLLSRLPPSLLDRLSPSDWASLPRILAPRLPANNIPLPVVRHMLSELSLGRFVAIESPSSSASGTPTRTGYGRQRILGGGQETTTWSIERDGSCPMCSLALSTVVGGRDAGVTSFSCSHAFHSLCLGERRVCVVCRARARRSRNAQTTVATR